jgi:error-prone DNA polymerase
MTSRYAELQVTSHFSFLRGASSCEELFAHAALIGIKALAVVDRNSLAGGRMKPPRSPASA